MEQRLLTNENDMLDIAFLSQNVLGLKDTSKIENIIDLMFEREIDIALLQETWLTGNFSKMINGCLFMHHGLKDANSNRGERGVAIVLSPSMHDACKLAGEMPPSTSSVCGNTTSGRFISIDIKLKCHFSCTRGAFRKKHHKHVNIELSIASAYYPVDIAEHDEMLEFMSEFLANLPPKRNVILCQDSNAKVGIGDDAELDEPSDVPLGKFGCPSRNAKGANLVNFARNFNLRIANTWFKHKRCATWKDFSARKNNHVIDHVLVNQVFLSQLTTVKLQMWVYLVTILV